MKFFVPSKKSLFVLIGLVVLMGLLFLVRKAQNSQVKRTAKPVKLPKAKLIPRKVMWHWVPQKEQAAQGFCEKNQTFLETVCTKAEQAWACVWLYEEAKSSAEKKHWLAVHSAIFQKRCEYEKNEAACEDLSNNPQADTQEVKYWHDKRNAIFGEKCEQDDDEQACKELYWRSDVGSLEEASWQEKYIAILQKKCEPHNHTEACEKIHEMFRNKKVRKPQVRDELAAVFKKQCKEGNPIACQSLYLTAAFESSEANNWRDKRDTNLRKLCEQQDVMFACITMDEMTKEMPENEYWHNKRIAIAQKDCEQGKDASLCDWLKHLAKNSSENQHWYDKRNAIWQRQCEQERKEEACQNLKEQTEDSEEKKHWQMLIYDIEKQECLSGKVVNCKLEMLKNLPPAEEEPVLKTLMSMCNQNARACSKLFQFYWVLCQREKQEGHQEKKEEFFENESKEDSSEDKAQEESTEEEESSPKETPAQQEEEKKESGEKNSQEPAPENQNVEEELTQDEDT